MYSVTVAGRVVGTFKKSDDAHDWAGLNLAVSFRVQEIDMRLRLARSLLIIGSRPRVRAPSFDVDVGVY